MLGLGLLSACSLEEPDTSVLESEVSVGTYTTTSCTTAVVAGLSKQIAEEVGCMSPGALQKFTTSARLQITSNAVLPYLHSAAKTNLEKVAETKTVQVNSAFRTVAQQYLLYRWYQLGRCGIPAAATPGNSNHEGGRALDLANYSSLVSAMASRGWSHNVPGDPVHFEHLSSPDQRSKDVKAFQRLWNRNHPDDRIAEDGDYGPNTEARLRMAPATGFATGATCNDRVGGAEVVMVQGPDRLAPGARATYEITVHNTGTLVWPADTKVQIADGTASALYDSETWTSPTEISTLGIDVPVGEHHVLVVDVRAPMVTTETPVFSQLEFFANGMMFGRIDLAATVTPNGDEDTSSDTEGEVEGEGGCAAGGSGGSWVALLLGMTAMFGRRRARASCRA